MATFDELVNQIDSNLDNQRDRGTAFEKMVVAYLKNEPTYKQKFSDVWMLNEVPEKYGIPKRDLGVDIVARDYAGNLTAVQAKYYKGKVGKATINSFVAEMGKDYYSAGLLVSSTDEWNRNAEAALENNTKPITRIGLSQLRHANIDWQKFSFAKENTLLTKKGRTPFPYQSTAINKAVAYFKTHDRGKLIMAPGTGKTFTSLKIAEALMEDQGKTKFNVLYLVPSIQLLSQTLFNWNNDISSSIHMTSFSVVSDSKANKKKSRNNDDLGAKDIGAEPTTNVDQLMNNYKASLSSKFGKDMTVVFSTYQSINVIHEAQKAGYPEFDLIVADEAHRTTGYAKLGQDTAFTEVHSNKNVKSKLRLYQTATPKIYMESAKHKASKNNVEVFSMDDPARYGEEIYRLGFGKAVSMGRLTDYKVVVLAVNESYVNRNMQNAMKQLDPHDIGKIIGVWNAMVKRNGITGEITGAPMKRAIAFTDNIKHSKVITEEFEKVVNEYLDTRSAESFKVDIKHVDGKLNALQKEEAIDWLADDNIEDNRARILSNVRFLTEGIDVPNLDAIIFFSPKKSQVDIVQAVGRIMRYFDGKEYGYIILPIVVPIGEDPKDALDNNKEYKQVWQVLNALRSTDERFEAEINNLDLNKRKGSKHLDVIGVDSRPDDDVTEDKGKEIEQNQEPRQLELELPVNWKEMQNAFYGKIVQKVGDRRYLEDWSKDVADIAKMYIRRINDLIESNDGAKAAFERFLTSLYHNINDSIDRDEAVEMLSQHLITEPVFDALFGDYSFVQNNVVSRSLNDVISAFKVFGFAKEQEKLKPFYESVKLRASGIDNAEGKQKLIVTLYQHFFKNAFPRVAEQMGIVFTPVEVVDFIIRSVDESLKKYFGKQLSDKGVHILDPFTGTGTFITRTLQYLKHQMNNGEITFDDVLRKYLHEIHANEILLLSYYIAAINIEAVFDEVNGPDRGYQPFEGIVLTDTFESTERKDSFMDELLGQNNERLKKQQDQPITAIISNPPYSVGQGNANDNNQNVHYPQLEKRIEQTYVENSKSSLSKSSYDSYIKAFRWASDRIGDKGVIGFVTNGSYLDSNSTDGLRNSLYHEFNHLYIFNLRGNQRTQGEKSRKEGGKIFGSGSRAPIAISILIKDGTGEHEIFYRDIGDYLSRQQKLNSIQKNKSISNMKWDQIIPDKNNDWLNQRDPHYQTYVSIVGENKSPFLSNAVGISTNRDIWVSGFSKQKVLENSKRLINNYNTEVAKNGGQGKKSTMRDAQKIKWTRSMDNQFKKGISFIYDAQKIRQEMYRPFVKKWLMYDRNIVESPGQYYKYWGQNNRAIVTTGRSTNKPFAALVTSFVPDVQMMMNGQSFMRFNHSNSNELLPDSDNVNINFANKLGLNADDAFAYVYALLNLPDYQQRYANDLRKDLARIPIVKDVSKYVTIGKQLIKLHLNYEQVPTYSDVDIQYHGEPDYRVTKMKFAKRRNNDGKLENDRSTIIFNDTITISNIPSKAYQYIVNGRSAIEWIMDQYRIKNDSKSGINDNPNDYSDDPKYIFNLLLRIINVSVQTMDLINQLPELQIVE